MIIIIMGVSGCGKTTIGKLLSEQLNINFLDADNFHPDQNINKMKQGIPLTDEDRIPWLKELASQLAKHKEQGGAVLACSALKESYRSILASQVDIVYWVLLHGDFGLIQARMESRSHFMPAGMLQSQFDTLEEPDYALKLDITNSPQEILNTILLKMKNL